MKLKISVLMPVFNSVKRNGDMIHQAINSLRFQTFENFQLIILDNQSTDETQKICYEYAGMDNRIKFMVDSKKRFPEGGINKLCEFVDTPYMMIFNDDDVLNPSYLEKLYAILSSHPEVDAVYSNGSFLDVSGETGGVIIPKENVVSYMGNIQQNYLAFIQNRNVVPLLFGLFKTESYQSAIPYKVFDDIAANVDNLFACRYFLNGNNAFFLNENLFFYRNKPRKLEAETIDGMPTDPILTWVFYLRHQLKFYLEVNKYLPDTTTKLVTLDSCMQRLHFLLSWVRKDLVKTDEQMKLCYSIMGILPELRQSTVGTSVQELHRQLEGGCYSLFHVLRMLVINLGVDDLLISTEDTLCNVQESLGE